MNLYMRTRIAPYVGRIEVDEKTIVRAAKYVARLNYLHFSQFTNRLETMTLSDYVEIMGGGAARL